MALHRTWIRRAASTGLLLLAGLALAQTARPDGTVTTVVAQPVPLIDAVRSKDRETAVKLLQAGTRASVNQRSVDGTTALHWAVYNDDADLAGRLIKAGADVNARNDYGATPLSQAAVTGNVPVI